MINFLGSKNSDKIFAFLLALAMIIAGARELYMVKQFNAQTDFFRVYQELNQHYSVLYRNYFAFDAEFKKVEAGEKTFYSNNALSYVTRAIDDINEMESLVASLSEEFIRPRLIDFNELKGNYQKIKINLESSNIQVIAIQSLRLNAFNDIQKLGLEINDVADEIKNFQAFEYRRFLIITFIFLFVSLLLLFLYMRNRQNRIEFSENVIKQNLKKLNDGDFIEDKKTVNSSFFEEIFNLSISLSDKMKIFNTTMIFLGNGEMDKAKESFPFKKESYLGKTFFPLVRAFILHDTKRNKEAKLSNIRIKRNDALSNLEREMRENIASENLYFIVLHRIIEFVGFNQGGFFLVRKNEKGKKELVLSAAYAYNHQRIITKRIEMTEGLIGTCAMEQNMIVLDQVPDNYLDIGSGLGEKKPNFLVLLPIVYQKETMGVMEFASFRKIDKFELQYLKEAASIIALFIVNRLREEQAEQGNFVLKKEKFYFDMELEAIQKLNSLFFNQISESFGILIFDSFGKLYNFSKQLENYFPETLKIGNTDLKNILTNEFQNEKYIMEKNVFEKVKLLNADKELITSFLLKNDNDENINSILFVCKF